MIKRTIEISREPAALCIDQGQLLILSQPPERTRVRPPALVGDRRRIPCEDIGVLIVDERDTTYTHTALATLMEHGAAVVVCGRDHMPAGILLPFSSHTEVLWRLDAQLNVRRPVCKRLWQQIVRAKILAQAANLAHAPGVRSRLTAIARGVRSNDAGGDEARAARLYWQALFDGVRLPGGRFRRMPGDRNAPAPNNLLDYGYAVMRAAVARALVGSGLFPALGLRHFNRSNAFALADDLVEPLRPLVDARVRELALRGEFALTPATKAELLILLTATVRSGGETGPLQVALSRYAASLVRCLEGAVCDLDIPTPLGVEPRGQTGNAPVQTEPSEAKEPAGEEEDWTDEGETTTT